MNKASAPNPTTLIQNRSRNKQATAKIKGGQVAGKRGAGATAELNDGKRTPSRPTGKNLKIPQAKNHRQSPG